jgi:hypothetical protein
MDGDDDESGDDDKRPRPTVKSEAGVKIKTEMECGLSLTSPCPSPGGCSAHRQYWKFEQEIAQQMSHASKRAFPCALGTEQETPSPLNISSHGQRNGLFFLFGGVPRPPLEFNKFCQPQVFDRRNQKYVPKHLKAVYRL